MDDEAETVRMWVQTWEYDGNGVGWLVLLDKQEKDADNNLWVLKGRIVGEDVFRRV